MMSLVFATVLMLLPPEQATPVGMVLTSKGKVLLERGPDKGRPVASMELLYAKDRLSAAPEGEARLVFFGDGHRERLKSAARATVGAQGCTPAVAVDQLAGKKLSAANLESLRSLARSERAAVKVFYYRMLRSPIDAANVLTVTPRFSWLPAAQRASYQVELLSGDGKATLWKATTEEQILFYPERRKPLEYGRSYCWRVTARLSGGGEKEVVRGRFQVLAKEEIDELAWVKTLAESADPLQKLLAAATYDAHGVYDEALDLFDRLAHVYPNEAHFQRALAVYYERAGNQVMAQRARERAQQLGAAVPGK